MNLKHFTKFLSLLTLLLVACLEEKQSVTDNGDYCSFEITSPTSSTVWTAGEIEAVYWNHCDLGGRADIELYKGNSKIATLASSSVNDGGWDGYSPSNLTSGNDYRVKITHNSDQGKTDFSSYFTITSGSSNCSFEITSPTTSTVWEAGEIEVVYWNDCDLGGRADIELYKGDSKIATLASSSVNDGGWDGYIPSNLTSGNDYRVKITHNTDQGKTDFSSYFTITSGSSNCSFEITSPTSSSVWTVGQIEAVYWEDCDLGGRADIELYKGDSKIATLATSSVNDGGWDGYIPSNLASGNDYRVKITHNSDQGKSDFSSYFTII